jgi:HD-like signal output (HDOD) protein
MLTEVRSKESAVAAALTRLSILATLPEVATRVLKLADDPNVTMSQLADVISSAPELSARILRIVNSAFYGFPGEVRSIERATTLMGLTSVRNVTIAASLTKVFQGRPLSAHFSPKDLWIHSLSVATATRLVAGASTPALADEAFLAGLLHDIGLIVELQVNRTKLAAVLAAVEAGTGQHILVVEAATFGATHQDFGAGLLHAWRLPSVFPLVAGCHHNPLTVPVADRTVPAMVFVADRLVTACSGPFLLDDPSPDITDDVLDAVHLTRDQVNEILTVMPDAVADAERIFGRA